MSAFKEKGRAARRAPRLAVDLPGSLVGRVAHPLRVVDLSAVGCLVRCPARLVPGAILDLRVQLGDEAIAAKVRVVESSLDGSDVPAGTESAMAGLEFVSLAAQDGIRLRRFLEDERKRRRSADAPTQ